MPRTIFVHKALWEAALKDEFPSEHIARRDWAHPEIIKENWIFQEINKSYWEALVPDFELEKLENDPIFNRFINLNIACMLGGDLELTIED